MKYCLAILVLCAGCLFSFGAEPGKSAADLEKMLKNRVKVGTVNSDVIRNDANEKIGVLKFHTYQDKRDSFDFRIRVTVELTDKEGKTCGGQVLLSQGKLPEQYTGEDDWEFQVPAGKMEKPKVTAFAVEYGVFQDKTFIPVAAEIKHAESADEIMKRSAEKLSVKCKRHIWYYVGML